MSKYSRELLNLFQNKLSFEVLKELIGSNDMFFLCVCIYIHIYTHTHTHVQLYIYVYIFSTILHGIFWGARSMKMPMVKSTVNVCNAY